MRDPNGRETPFAMQYYGEADLARNVIGDDFGVFVPASELALRRIESDWQQRRDENATLIARTVAFGSTPVVFFVRPEAVELFAESPLQIGWAALADLANRAVPLRIRHASFQSEGGLAVALAARLALGARLSTAGAADEAEERVRSIEQCVDEYGPDDESVVDRAVGSGAWNADVVIAQERSVLSVVEQRPEVRGTVAYPVDGALRVRSVAASTRSAWRTDTETAFTELSERLTACPTAQLHAFGLHASNGSPTAQGAATPFVAAHAGSAPGLRWAVSPQTRTTVLPSTFFVNGLQAVARSTKRAWDMYLLFDASSSMEGDGKAARAAAALRVFVRLIDAPGARVALVRVRDTADVITPLSAPDAFAYDEHDLAPRGETALWDAVMLAVRRFEESDRPAERRTLVGFTDGQDTASTARREDAEEALRRSNVRFYGIAYGDDADVAGLAALADAGRGVVVRGGTTEIAELYTRIASYV